jgi:rubrerythrin
MTVERSLDILKQALLLEKRGKSFYGRVAEHTQHASVRDFFSMMADEEQRHIEILLKQFKSLKESGQFAKHDFSAAEDIFSTANRVVDQEIVKQISGADYESAAVMAAISMEERAVKIYSERYESCSDPEEKNLYGWLVSWERGHLHQLLNLDQMITEKIWLDNSYWPF